MHPPPKWVVNLVVLCVMKFCASVTFSTLRTIKITDYTWNVVTQQCTYQPRVEGHINEYYMVFYIAIFFLPALGGLLVDKWFGELRVLRTAGIFLFLTGVYITSVENSKLMCQPIAFILGFVPSCLAYGIGLAPLIAAPLKLSEGHLGSPIPGLLAYYASASLGEFLGFVPRYIRSKTNLTWVVCVFPLVYILMSFMLKLDWTEFRRRVQYELDDRFTFPTKTRTRRYFLLLAPLVLFVSIVDDVRGVTYCLEMDYYLNCTGNCTSVICSEIYFTGYNVATVATIILLALLYKFGFLGEDGRVIVRFYIGSSALLFSKTAFIAWHLWAASLPHLPDPVITQVVYAIASALDGVSNGFALASGYEMLYRIALANNKNLIMALLFTMYSTGAGATFLTTMIMTKFPPHNAVFKPIFGVSNKLYVSYVVMAIESLLIPLYFTLFNAKMVRTMMVVSDNHAEGHSSAYINLTAVNGDMETIETSSTIQHTCTSYGAC